MLPPKLRGKTTKIFGNKKNFYGTEIFNINKNFLNKKKKKFF